MQLDLFEDNRLGILMNLAHEFIVDRNLVQAVSVYEQIVAEYPEDTRCIDLLRQVSECRDLLDGINHRTVVQENLRAALLHLESINLPALRSAVLGILIDELSALPHAEQIYAPPRFHIGQVLMDAGRHAEAADSFLAALSFPNIERGKFLAWRGDALTLAGSDEAPDCYLAAFLDDPCTVDIPSIKNRTITNLYTALLFEGVDEIDESDVPAWLPVWGWLMGEFTLPLQPVGGVVPTGSSEFEDMLARLSHSAPHIWFKMLIQAERLRVMIRDDRELGAVRRLMKRTNGFMFGCYLEKIKGKR